LLKKGKRAYVKARILECGRQISELNKLTELARKYSLLNNEIKDIELKIKNEKNLNSRDVLKDEQLTKIKQKNKLKIEIDDFLSPASKYENKNIIVEISTSSNKNESISALKDLFFIFF